MKKNYIFIFIGIVLIFIIGIAIYFFYSANNTSDNPNNKSISRLASNVDNSEAESNQTNNTLDLQNETLAELNQPLQEEELGTYSTPLKSKASGRLNNIKITCSALNGKIVANGETFSFCNTLGPSTAEKGYQEADVIVNGEFTKALGGGNCQVSSTLYNVVLNIPELEVIERHEHGKAVSYVPQGKDAAVSYGSMDLKFKNSTGNDIKMYFSSDDENVVVKIVKLI